MRETTYRRIEDHMRACMTDSAHDFFHVYRVLYLALDIAQAHPEADQNVLIAACLLHDIGRAAQALDPRVCHAREGADRARAFLLEQGIGAEIAAKGADGAAPITIYDAAEYANRVADCIRTHRYRGDDAPQTIEAKILFDADKLEAAGAMGIARTLIYQGQENLCLYNVDADGNVLDGAEREEAYGESFFMEYRRKLANVRDTLFTEEARREADRRGGIAEAFYRALLSESDGPTRKGMALLRGALTRDA